MAALTYSSWGRTRRPKQLSDEVPPAMQTATTVTPVAEGNLSDALTGTNAGENGYSTQNQRWLHVLCKVNNNKKVEIYAYNYAWGEWAPLKIPKNDLLFQKSFT